MEVLEGTRIHLNKITVAHLSKLSFWCYTLLTRILSAQVRLNTARPGTRRVESYLGNPSIDVEQKDAEQNYFQHLSSPSALLLRGRRLAICS